MNNSHCWCMLAFNLFDWCNKDLRAPAAAFMSQAAVLTMWFLHVKRHGNCSGEHFIWQSGLVWWQSANVAAHLNCSQLWSWSGSQVPVFVRLNKTTRALKSNVHTCLLHFLAWRLSKLTLHSLRSWSFIWHLGYLVSTCWHTLVKGNRHLVTGDLTV